MVRILYNSSQILLYCNLIVMILDKPHWHNCTQNLHFHQTSMVLPGLWFLNPCLNTYPRLCYTWVVSCIIRVRHQLNNEQFNRLKFFNVLQLFLISWCKILDENDIIHLIGFAFSDVNYWFFFILCSNSYNSGKCIKTS